jgi:hypothetical protein
MGGLEASSLGLGFRVAFHDQDAIQLLFDLASYFDMCEECSHGIT